MSDDIWRRRDDTTEGGGSDYGTDFGSDFGTIQFADDPTSEPAIVFADTDSTGLPHWTEPPTGEIPRAGNVEDEDDTDVWASFQQPSQPTRRPERLVIGGDSTGDRGRPRDVTGDTTRDPSRDTPRDITGGTSRPVARGPQVRRGTTRGPRGAAGRDMPTAVTTGLILLAVFIGAVMWRPAAVMLIVVAVLGLASVEFFSKVTEKGYRPATFAGLIACVAAPLAAYWMGDAVLPLIVVFTLMACAIVFVAGDSIDISPTPQIAVTLFGVLWIGFFGSFAALILRLSTTGSFAGTNIGTDTLFIVVIGVIANDIAAYFVGSAVGRTPLRDWISPNKSTEGLIGGTLGTFGAVIIVGLQSTTWNGLGEWLALAIVISIVAPLGDLVESMIKRNVGVKDFGTILTGHGGVLDRFDSMLFALPAVYYLALVLQPWG